MHDLPKDAGDDALARLDKFRHANGSTPTAEMRVAMQKAMQDDAAVFRTGETLKNGQKRIARYLRDARRHQGQRPLDDLELRSGRDAGISRT